MYTSARKAIHPRMTERLARIVAGAGVAGDDGTLPDRAMISRLPTPRVPNGLGGWRGTYEDIASDVPCRVESESGGSELVQGSRIVAVTTWRVTLPVGTDVQEADRITIEDKGVFEVQAILDPQSYSAETAVRCVEVK